MMYPCIIVACKCTVVLLGVVKIHFVALLFDRCIKSIQVVVFSTVDMTIKLCPSTNCITNMHTTDLHVCKQQHTPTANYTCFSQYLKHLSRYVYETSQTPRL